MRNLTANFGKILDICKDFSKNLVNERGNLPRRGVVPRFSDLEVIALSLTAEKYSIDSESLLFSLLGNTTKQTSRTSFLVASTLTVASSPPTYANKYESTSPRRLMETKIIFVLIQSRYLCVVLPVQSVAN